ncbi:NfeD family protein [Longimicrobium sp.]|jgi:membrane-bound serine protease (ClpP class)|uniref:NfeD family protein n=1 Tax=Longimicrobium sp. TaxID=2029185 RepID=UPI002EDAE761
MRRTALFALLLSLVPPATAHTAPLLPPSTMPLGIAGWEPLLILMAGIVLLLVELFVLPGFGVAGILGVLAMIAGVAIVLGGPTPGAGDAALAGFAVVSALTLLGVAAWAIVASRRGGYKALFGGTLDREGGYLAAVPRPELEGLQGVAITNLRPAGTAEVAGERLDVVSDGGWIDAGTPVRVLRAEGYRHVVQPLALPKAPEAEG